MTSMQKKAVQALSKRMDDREGENDKHRGENNKMHDFVAIRVHDFRDRSLEYVPEAGSQPADQGNVESLQRSLVVHWHQPETL
jgi:hypothetical protein